MKQLRDTRPDLAPENLDADALVAFDRELVTNESQRWSFNEIVNEYLSQPDITSDEDEIPEPELIAKCENGVDEAIEILNRLILFTTDLELDSQLLKVTSKINERRLDGMKQSSITEFFQKHF